MCENNDAYGFVTQVIQLVRVLFAVIVKVYRFFLKTKASIKKKKKKPGTEYLGKLNLSLDNSQPVQASPRTVLSNNF